MITVAEAVTPSQLDAVRDLMRAFSGWQRQAYHDYIDLVEKYFDPQIWDAELAGLPGAYAPPSGRLLLAADDDQPVGCVALRPIDSDIAEMKRMFVLPQTHGKGVGRALAERLIHEAKGTGYKCMRLDTGPRQLAAHSLYRSLGFKEIAPYYDVPEDLRTFILFMELVF